MKLREGFALVMLVATLGADGRPSSPSTHTIGGYLDLEHCQLAASKTEYIRRFGGEHIQFIVHFVCVSMHEIMPVHADRPESDRVRTAPRK
jgi:hypothetical protein